MINLVSKHMNHRKLLVAFLVSSFLAVSSSSGREIDLEKPSPKLRRFVSDIIFMVEIGDREKYSKRLPESIIVPHGEAGPKAVTEKHLTEFCKITGVKRLEETSSEESAAKIDIYFGIQSELVKVANEMERKITVERGSAYWTWWDEQNTIDRAAVFISTDKLQGAALEDKLIEQLMGVFGLPARSKEFDESCVASKEQVLTSLQPLDKALLEFYYRAVPVGTKPQEVDKIFLEKWAVKH